MRNLPRRPNNLNQVNHFPIKEYIEAVGQRDNRLWSLKNGVLYTKYNGVEITAEEFGELPTHARGDGMGFGSQHSH